MTSISQYNVVNCGSGEGNEGANLGQLMTQFNAVKNISQWKNTPENIKIFKLK